MNHTHIFHELERNARVFETLLDELKPEEYLWRPAPEKWCLLEIICHLYDEEREDFRARLASVLENPEAAPPPIDPEGWVSARNYMSRDFNTMLRNFLGERRESIHWLHSLSDPQWDNAWQHPEFGPMSANMLLANWLEHDYLHIRQILGLKHLYLKSSSGQILLYAGEW